MVRSMKIYPRKCRVCGHPGEVAYRPYFWVDREWCLYCGAALVVR